MQCLLKALHRNKNVTNDKSAIKVAGSDTVSNSSQASKRNDKFSFLMY